MKSFRHIAIFLASFILISCTSRQIVNPEYLDADTTKHIRIVTKQGTTIKFTPGNYKISHFDDSVYVTGKGICITNGKKSREDKYEGNVNYNEIAVLEISEAYIPKAILYPIGFVLGVSLISVIAFLISMNGRGFGG